MTQRTQEYTSLLTIAEDISLIGRMFTINHNETYSRGPISRIETLPDGGIAIHSEWRAEASFGWNNDVTWALQKRELLPYTIRRFDAHWHSFESGHVTIFIVTSPHLNPVLTIGPIGEVFEKPDQ